MGTQTSFAGLELAHRPRKTNALSKIDKMIDWERIRPLLQGLYKRDYRGEDRNYCGGGQQPFDELMMFKAVLLGQWHSLSDPKLEEALYVRIDFLDFCGIGLNDAIPDESTLCRFRNRLIKAQRMEALLGQINTQIQAHGLMVKSAQAAIIDATLITSAARPKSQHIIDVLQSAGDGNEQQGQESEEGNTTAAPQSNEPAAPTSTLAQATEPVVAVTVAQAPLQIPRLGTQASHGADAQALIYLPSTQSTQSTLTHSADSDATWVKKNNRSTFGYRCFFAVDDNNGFIRGLYSTPANVSEFHSFAPTLAAADFKPKRVYADKGFSSKKNRQHLMDQQIKSGIMHKAVRGKPLSERAKAANKLMSKTRWIVEQAFGTIKRIFNFSRASYFGTVKVQAQMAMKSMCYNLLKAANKITLNSETKEWGVVRPMIA